MLIGASGGLLNLVKELLWPPKAPLPSPILTQCLNILTHTVGSGRLFPKFSWLYLSRAILGSYPLLIDQFCFHIKHIEKNGEVYWHITGAKNVT